MLNCLCLFVLFFILFYFILFFDVLFYAVKTDTKLALDHMWNIFIIELIKIKFKIWRVTFLKSFLPLFFGGRGWTSGFHAIDDWPRAH